MPGMENAYNLVMAKSSVIIEKTEITVYNTSPGFLPAINVKVYNPGWNSETVKTEYGCSEKTAENAAQEAWDLACSAFWRYWADDADLTEYFPGHGKLEVFSEGRSGGWLVLSGLPEFEDWTSDLLAQWESFVTAVNDTIKHYSSWAYAKDEINDLELARDEVVCPTCGTSVHPRSIQEPELPSKSEMFWAWVRRCATR